jgi:2-dehydropantoate 2-reductase
VVQASSVPTAGIVDVGRVPASRGALSRAGEIAGVFAAAGFSAVAVDDIMRWKYAKLIMNLGNAVEALCGPEARGSEIARLAREEGIAVLKAAGIDYVGDAEYATRRGNLITPQSIGGAPRPGDSSWQSLARGTGAIEADYLNGEIVLLGRLWGVASPVNALLQREANVMAAEKRPPGTRRVEELLALVAKEDF